MTFSELQDEVLVKLQDNSTDITSRISDWINDAVEDAIETVDMPGYKTFTTVATIVDQAYATLPNTCDGRVLYVGNADNEIDVYSFEFLLESYPKLDSVGSVKMVAIEGTLIYYQGIPSAAETLVLLFRRTPTRMSLSTDTPDGIPDHLHRSVIVPKASSYGFDLIEDGMEGQKVNMLAQEGHYQIGLQKLGAYAARRKCHLGRSVWRY